LSSSKIYRLLPANARAVEKKKRFFPTSSIKRTPVRAAVKKLILHSVRWMQGLENILNQGRVKILDKYVCSVCGYVYDPEEEDAPFLELSDDWVCPICGALKEQFDKEN